VIQKELNPLFFRIAFARLLPSFISKDLRATCHSEFRSVKKRVDS
jgi:hypothetical protein